MVGPVSSLEMLNTARSGQHHRLRLAYQLILLVEFTFFLFSWLMHMFVYTDRGPPCERTVGLAWWYFALFAGQHILVLTLVTPALAAGALSDEKTRGTLGLLLATDLSSGEIVLGKWLGQVVQVLTLSMVGWPILVLLGTIGGMDAGILLLGLLKTVLLVMGLSAGSLLAAVWARKTATAAFGLYVATSVPVLVLWQQGLVRPFDALAFWDGQFDPAGPGGRPMSTPLVLAVVAVVIVVCLGLATWRLRPAYAAQLVGRSGRKKVWRWLARPVVTDAPLRWKERYVGELGFLSYARWLPYGARLMLVMVLSLALSVGLGSSDDAFLIHGLGFLVVVSGLVGVRSSGVISGERERQSWESILLTPLEVKQLVRGKLWGIIDSARPYLLAYLGPALVWALPHGLWPIYCTLFFWFAAWGLLYFQGANGVYWSARSSGSWQSLLKTATSAAWAFAYRAFLVVIPGSLFLVGGISFRVLLTCLLGVVVTQLFAHAEYLLQQAERYIAREERIKQGPPTSVARRQPSNLLHAAVPMSLK